MELSWGKGLPSDLLERWPKTPSGEPEKAVFFCNCKAPNLDDELKINMLEAYGIPCLRDYRDVRSREQAGGRQTPLRRSAGRTGTTVKSGACISPYMDKQDESGVASESVL